ncbi:MAG: hypothetical protein REJ50_21385, partial [Bordetella sp.]|nr:hypothetical protein [Bordetella sp.]
MPFYRYVTEILDGAHGERRIRAGWRRMRHGRRKAGRWANAERGNGSGRVQRRRLPGAMRHGRAGVAL